MGVTQIDFEVTLARAAIVLQIQGGSASSWKCGVLSPVLLCWTMESRFVISVTS
jgi:hypothetical protein